MRNSILLLAIGILAGCGTKPPPVTVAPVDTSGYYPVDEQAIEFLDEAATNSEPDDAIADLTFTNKAGEQVALKDFLGKQNVVLVITRGYSGAICPYCATQTSRLIANHSKFRDRDTEIVVVYPLEKPADQKHLEIFVAKSVARLPEAEQKVPFPLLLDIELKAVDALGIRKNLSKPATYIFDKEGKVRFAYVGNTLADRPSIKVLLEQLDRINKPDA